MRVFLCKNVEKVGFAGEIVKVSNGFAKNFIIPRKMGVEITSKNQAFYESKVKKVEHRKEALVSETSMLAETIKSTELTLKRKTHDGNKLYSAVGASEVVDLLVKKGIKASKSQVIFDKSIKTLGAFSVTIKLSSRLQPILKLTVVAE